MCKAISQNHWDNKCSWDSPKPALHARIDIFLMKYYSLYVKYSDLAHFTFHQAFQYYELYLRNFLNFFWRICIPSWKQAWKRRVGFCHVQRIKTSKSECCDHSPSPFTSLYSPSPPYLSSPLPSLCSSTRWKETLSKMRDPVQSFIPALKRLMGIPQFLNKFVFLFASNSTMFRVGSMFYLESSQEFLANLDCGRQIALWWVKKQSWALLITQECHL